MNQISILNLPNMKPTREVINSWSDWGDCIERYEPGMWKLEYLVTRYLKYIPDEELIERYEDIHRNFSIFTGAERNTISILSYLSSWYWYRKEYQTRYEFFLRKLPLPKKTPKPQSENNNNPYKVTTQNFCEILFRYGNLEFTKSFIEKGEIRLSPASRYKKGEKRDPRTDDELNKKRTQFIEGNEISTIEGQKIQLKNGIQWTTSSEKNYYLLSLSTDFEHLIFDEFNYNSCVIIKNPKEFKNRLDNALSKFLPKSNWYFHSNPIGYFDPYEKAVKNEYFSSTMTKDFKYAYQKEYRYLWNPIGIDSAKDYINISLGSLNDICELYTHH